MAFNKKQKQPFFKDIQMKRPVNKLTAFLRWKGFEGTDDLLVLSDANGDTTGYLEMITIYGKDLDFVYGKGSAGASQIIQDYHSFLRTYLEDFDILITQMPADARVQTTSWSNELAKIEQEMGATSPQNKRYKQLLMRHKIVKTELNHTRFVEQNLSHEAYTAFVYGETKAEVRQQRQAFMNSGGTALSTSLMTRKQKEFILSIMMDPTIQLKGEN